MPRPGDERPALPSNDTDDPTPRFTLPPLQPPAAGAAPLSDGVRVFVKAFEVEGNTVFSTQQLEQVLDNYAGRMVDGNELRKLRRELTLLYIENGYITSGVVIPDQKVSEGTVRLRVIEGNLARVNVGGDPRLRERYVLDRLDIATGNEPLRVQSLQQQLANLQGDPLVERVRAQLTPGVRLGESVLSVDVDQVRPYDLVFRINNHRNPTVGAVQGELDATYRNLSGLGEAVNVRVRQMQGLRHGAALVSVPLPTGAANPPRLSIGYRRGESKIVEEPFDKPTIKSRFSEALVGLSQTIVRTPLRSIDVAVNLERRRSESFIEGQPFDFAPGAPDGRSDVSVIRLVGDLVDRAENRVFALRSTFSIGIDALGATRSTRLATGTDAAGNPRLSDTPDGRFLSWLGQTQYAHRFSYNDNELVLRGDLQLSDDTLLSLAKFGVGGANGVRGYRENQLVRDNGWAASAELRVPVLREVERIGRLQVAAFIDYGGAWNESGSSAPRSIGSAGLGLRWKPAPDWDDQVYGALPFRNIEDKGDELQDAGVHFSVSYRAF